MNAVVKTLPVAAFSLRQAYQDRRMSSVVHVGGFSLVARLVQNLLE